jgi:outer membrane protein assembly factor BamB
MRTFLSLFLLVSSVACVDDAVVMNLRGGALATAAQVSPGSSTDTSIRIQPRWQLVLSKPSALAYRPEEHTQPAYNQSGEIVVAGSSAGVVVAADARSGKRLWIHEVPEGVSDGLLIQGNDVYVAGVSGAVFKLDVRTGSSLWEQPYVTPGSITSAPVFAKNRLVVQTNENRTYVIDAQNGSYLWDKGRPRAEGLSISGEGGAAVAGDVVYAGYDDGVLMAMNLMDGSTLWSRSLSGDALQFVDVDTRPVVVGDTVYAGSFSVGFFAVGRKHGNIRWAHRTEGVQSATARDGRVYVSLRSHEVRALDASTGDVLWRTRVGRLSPSRPVVSSNGLWVATGDGVLWLDPNDGNIRARISPDDGQTAPIAVRDGWIHMVTNFGAFVGARLL